MSASADTFARGFDLRGERRRRLRHSLRIIVPIVTLLILLASIAGIGTYLFEANRADARGLADDLLEELQRRIVAEVVEFLDPAAFMVRSAEQLLVDESLEEQRVRVDRPFTAHMLTDNPQLATFYFGDPQGNFTMLKKMPDGSIHTKLMDRRGDKVDSRWIRRESSGKVLAVEPQPDDTYDPRDRPWYQGALAGTIYWSDVYVFFTDQRPGITVSMPAYAKTGELATVFAVDIDLEQLVVFLGSLEIGQTGTAMIIDSHGFFVAHPMFDKMLKETDRGLALVHIEELGDPVLNRAFDRLRVDGPGKRRLLVDGDRYINTAISLNPVLGRDWTLLILAPEEDFVGFVTKNARRGLYMSVAVLGLASLLAGLLVVQGLRADRNAQLVRDRQGQLEAQSRAFSQLAAQAAQFDSNDHSSVYEFVETIAHNVGARRVSIWHLARDGHGLVCEGAFDKESAGHTGGMELSSAELPQYFDSLARAEEIVSVDAAAEPRTAELHRLYLNPLGCKALASVPIVEGQQVVGAIWLEDDGDGIRPSSPDVIFARDVANILASRVAASGTVRRRDGAPRRASAEQMEIMAPMRETELISGRRAQALLTRISREQGDGARMGAQVFEDITVAVIQCTDPLSLAAAVDEEYENAANELVLKLEALGIEHGVEYLKLLGSQIVCAAGFTQQPERGAEIVADFSLGALDYAARLFARLERKLAIQIGVDSGPVIGSAVGRDHSIFNLWGEAVLAATRLAETSAAGQIQTTASTYRQLREDFLFRVRGSYYLEGFGEFTTYLLTGRL